MADKYITRDNDMIQFREGEVCDLIKAATYYRDHVTGSDYMWDKYNDVIMKLYKYGEDASPHPVSCTNTELKKS